MLYAVLMMKISQSITHVLIYISSPDIDMTVDIFSHGVLKLKW